MKTPENEPQGTPPERAVSEKEILRARARKLAQPQEMTATGDAHDVLVFRIANEHYAITRSCLYEIQPLRTLTPLPGTPDFILGVIVNRGQVVAVMDLRVLLGQGGVETGTGGEAILLGRDQARTALFVHAVEGLQSMPDEELNAGETIGKNLDSIYISGVSGAGIVLLNGETLLSNPALIVNH